MKKLITAIAAIATSFGLFAADAFTTSVLSDIQSKTNNLVVGYDTTGATMLDDTGDVTVNWFADSLKTDFTTKMETYEQPELKVGEDEEGPYQYLAIDTDVGDPVLRTFNNVVEDTGVDNFKYNNIAISDHGVFIDTETTFTLFDTVPESPSDSKILVWARETEADEEAGIAGATNLMVTCGVEIDKTFHPTNYVLAVEGIVPEQMYRLTIRADKEKDSENTIFRVYLNGTQLKTVALDDGTTLEVFPSLVGQVQELGAAGFGGTGSLKGIDLLTQDDAPAKVPFAIDPTYLTVTWNEGVASFTIAQDGCTNQVIEVTGSGETNLVVKAGAATVTPTFVSNPQYKLQDFLNEDETLSLEYEGNVASIDIPLYADASTLAIIAVQDREGAELWVTLTDEEQPIKIGAARPHVKDAIAALSELTPEQQEKGADVVKIVLLMDEQNTDFGDWAAIGAGSAIILDLNGHTMEAIEPWNPDDDYRSMINVGGTPVTIMDSSVTGGGMIKGIVNDEVPEDSVWPIYNTSSLTIMKAEGTAECKFYGTVYNDTTPSLEGDITIEGGLFSDITYLDSEFVTLPDNKEWSADTIDGYYYLTEPGAVTLSLTAGAHNSITSEPAAGSIAPGAEVTVTVTPDEGYQFASTPDGWDAGASGTIVSNFTITADTAIIAPDATAIEYALTLTGNDTVTITSDQSDNTQIPYDTQVKVTVEPKTDYEFAEASYEGWEKEGLNLVSNFVMKGATTITAPTATAIKYAITWAESENVVATNNGVQVESGITLAKDATITFYPTVGSITNIVVDGEAVAVSSPYTFTVKAQASVLKVLAGVTAAPSPTPVDPSQGTIVPDGKGNYVITPTGSEITVQNPGDNKFIVDVATDFTIKGVAAANITVKCNGEDITAVCKGGDAEGFSTELDPTQTTPVLIEATATEQPLVVGTTVDLKIKQSVPGLAYKLLRVGEVGDFSASEKITKVATVKGDGETLTLTDSTKPANKAFYKVAVGKDVINESAD